ncbi:MAG: hypothetical protein M3Q11_04580 [Pseudomonadota bacterium]|jgi:hypothetical protein|nr:hypothetical protein [Pseudomonadota bacterium]
MNKRLHHATLASVLACGMFAGAAMAQQQEGLVNVNVTDVELLNNIANDLDVNVSQIPVTVQAPIGIAANVCDVNANVLAAQGRGQGGSCDAKNTSQAFNKLIQRQMNQQGGGQQGG